MDRAFRPSIEMDQRQPLDEVLNLDDGTTALEEHDLDDDSIELDCWDCEREIDGFDYYLYEEDRELDNASSERKLDQSPDGSDLDEETLELDDWDSEESCTTSFEAYKALDEANYEHFQSKYRRHHRRVRKAHDFEEREDIRSYRSSYDYESCSLPRPSYDSPLAELKEILAGDW